MLTNLFENISDAKVVLHFYHTVDKIMIQGSTLISSVSSAVWMVEHFINPLAKRHIESNSHLINSINEEILSNPASSRYDPNLQPQPAQDNKTCSYCHAFANPMASAPKDQIISCGKCKKCFHKKCTDRRGMKSNWRRSPWFCQECMIRNTSLNSEAPIFHPSGSISAVTFRQEQIHLQDQTLQSPQQTYPKMFLSILW